MKNSFLGLSDVYENNVVNGIIFLTLGLFGSIMIKRPAFCAGKQFYGGACYE